MHGAATLRADCGKVVTAVRDDIDPNSLDAVLWSIAYRAPDRTLTDVEVDRAHEGIVARLVENLPAQRR